MDTSGDNKPDEATATNTSLPASELKDDKKKKNPKAGIVDSEEAKAIALERLSDDRKLIIEKLDGLLDTLTHPLRDAIEQVKNAPKNTTYDEKQLTALEHAVMKQLQDLERDISS